MDLRIIFLTSRPEQLDIHMKKKFDFYLMPSKTNGYKSKYSSKSEEKYKKSVTLWPCISQWFLDMTHEMLLTMKKKLNFIQINFCASKDAIKNVKK